MNWYDGISSVIHKATNTPSSLLNQPARVVLQTQYATLHISNADIVGGIIQNWFAAWLNAHNISNIVNPSSQEPPDLWIYYAGIPLPVEVKCFKADSDPAFDISDFYLYMNSVLNDPLKLDYDYIVFDYSLVGNEITINTFSWKKVWELVGKSTKNVVSMQTRQDGKYPNKLRPYNFRSQRNSNAKIKDRKEFVNLLEEAAYIKFKNSVYQGWASQVENKYLSITGRPL